MAIGSAWPVRDELKAEVRGRDLARRACPRPSSSRPAEIREAIDDVIVEIVESVIACLGKAPPELAHDLISQGMYLVGGGGMLAGPRPAHRPRHRDRRPPGRERSESVVLGAGRCIEDPAALRVAFQALAPALLAGWASPRALGLTSVGPASGGVGPPSVRPPCLPVTSACRLIDAARRALVDDRRPAHARRAGRPGRPARRRRARPGRGRPRRAGGLVRRHGRGRGHPVGQDRRLPRGLPLLLAVVAVRLARSRPSRCCRTTRCWPRPARPPSWAPASSAWSTPCAAPTSG